MSLVAQASTPVSLGKRDLSATLSELEASRAEVAALKQKNAEYLTFSVTNRGRMIREDWITKQQDPYMCQTARCVMNLINSIWKGIQ